jgi:glycosyltransferase involved in cell wall biosynthesis
MRILSLSTHGEPCGIGDYNAALVKELAALGHECSVVRIGRQSDAARDASVADFLDKLPSHDLGIIQHEWIFYGADFRTSANAFARLVRRAEKPLAVFFHTNFPELPPNRTFRPFGPTAKVRAAKRGMVRALNGHRALRAFLHGDRAIQDFAGRGVDPDKLIKIIHPLTREPNPARPRKVSDGDPVTLLIYGFIGAYKGYETTLNALRLLPSNFRLVIAGDRHPHAPRDQTLDSIYGFMHTGSWPRPSTNVILPPVTASEIPQLRKRISVLGHVADEAVSFILNEADIVLAPYSSSPAASGALARSIALGRPIIATAHEPFLDIQRQGNCLKIVAPDAPYELAEAIRALAGNYADRCRLQQNALALAERNSFAHLAQLVLRECLGQAPISSRTAVATSNAAASSQSA